MVSNVTNMPATLCPLIQFYVFLYGIHPYQLFITSPSFIVLNPEFVIKAGIYIGHFDHPLPSFEIIFDWRRQIRSGVGASIHA